jgi:antitoxin component of MazEF toxin-antitoxin module
MDAETKVARYGNSLTVRLPVGITRELDLREGDRVVLRTVDAGVLIECLKRSRLAARLATVRQRESEVGAGRTVGAEIDK